MDDETLKARTAHNARRALIYLHQAQRVASAKFGEHAHARDPMIAVSLAAAMMNLEAADIMAEALSAATSEPLEDE